MKRSLCENVLVESTYICDYSTVIVVPLKCLSMELVLLFVMLFKDGIGF